MEVEILVASTSQEAIDDVAAELAAAGLHGSSTLRGIGVITGTVDDRGKLDDLRAVDGVEGVKEGGRMGVPPPDEPIQ